MNIYLLYKLQNKHYDLELEEVIIGTPSNSKNDQRIEQILEQLRDRQVAKEQVETFNAEQLSAQKEKELNEARAKASQQTDLTKSSLDVQIAENNGEAEKITQIAKANADKILLEGNADSTITTKKGIAQGIATSEQVTAYGTPRNQVIQSIMTEIAKSLKESNVQLVPHNVIGSSEGTTNVIENLLNILLSKLDDKDIINNNVDDSKSQYIKSLKDKIFEDLKNDELNNNTLSNNQQVNNNEIKEDK